MWKAQKKAPITTKESPNLTRRLLSSLKNSPPTKHIKTDGQTELCIFFEKRKQAITGTITTYKTVNTAELATSVYSRETC